MTVTNNSPSAGYIAWTDLNIQYEGVSYAIANGNTNLPFAYWTLNFPNNLVVSEEYPQLATSDCLVFLNKSGIAVVVPTSTILDGDLIVPGSVMAVALAANTVTGDKIAAGTIDAYNILAESISAELLAVNAVGAQAIAAEAITGDKLVAETITAREVNAEDIFANNATVQQLIAAGINVDTLFAREATISKLNTSLLSTENYITIASGVTAINGELTANKNYLRLGKLINSSNEVDTGIAIGKSLKTDVNGNVLQAGASVQITGDRQTFFQNGIVGMELRDGSVNAGHGNFGDVTTGGKWRQTVDADGTFAILWVG